LKGQKSSGGEGLATASRGKLGAEEERVCPEEKEIFLVRDKLSDEKREPKAGFKRGKVI